jgi:hypothetical protein
MTDQTTEPATATEARAVLSARVADKEWGSRVFAGDIAANKELRQLTEKVAAGGDDVVAAAMSGALGAVPSSEQRQMAGTAEMFREWGIRDEITQQFLSGQQVTQQELELVKNWKILAMGDRSPGGFVERYLAGDATAKQKMLIANSVLTNGAKEAAA